MNLRQDFAEIDLVFFRNIDPSFVLGDRYADSARRAGRGIAGWYSKPSFLPIVDLPPFSRFAEIKHNEIPVDTVRRPASKDPAFQAIPLGHG